MLKEQELNPIKSAFVSLCRLRLELEEILTLHSEGSKLHSLAQQSLSRVDQALMDHVKPYNVTGSGVDYRAEDLRALCDRLIDETIDEDYIL